MGKAAHRISEEQALDHIAGHFIHNDVSARDWPFRRGDLTGKGKRAPGCGPLGPSLFTTDEIPDPQQLQIRTWVNGEIRREAPTSGMPLPVAKFIAHVSEFMALLPGDVSTTARPEGVAAGTLG